MPCNVDLDFDAEKDDNDEGPGRSFIRGEGFENISVRGLRLRSCWLLEVLCLQAAEFNSNVKERASFLSQVRTVVICVRGSALPGVLCRLEALGCFVDPVVAVLSWAVVG